MGCWPLVLPGAFLCRCATWGLNPAKADYESAAFTRLLVAQTPPVGLEPTTDRLEDDCYYPAELRGLTDLSALFSYSFCSGFKSGNFMQLQLNAFKRAK